MGILECASRDGITANPVSAGQCWLFATLPQRETPNHQTCRAPTPARHPAAIGNCVLLVSHKFGWRVSLAHHHCAAQQSERRRATYRRAPKTLLWTPITGCRVQSVQPCVLRPGMSGRRPQFCCCCSTGEKPRTRRGGKGACFVQTSQLGPVRRRVCECRHHDTIVGWGQVVGSAPGAGSGGGAVSEAATISRAPPFSGYAQRKQNPQVNHSDRDLAATCESI